MGNELINPYGTEWHDQIDGHKCDECSSVCSPEFVVSERGYPDPFGFCSKKCMLHWIWKSHWADE